MKKYIIISLVFISLSSCRTVKKEWVKENFTEKATTQQIRVAQDSVFRSEIQKIETSVSQLETSVSKIETSKTSESETENTNVSGTIEAEDGKEKSVTIGNTTIKSNGANVSFSTSNTKTLTKEFERQLQEITQQLEFERTFNQTLQTEINSLKSEFANFTSTYESEKTTKTKEVTKRNFTLTTWLIIIGVLVLLYFIYRFRKKLKLI